MDEIYILTYDIIILVGLLLRSLYFAKGMVTLRCDSIHAFLSPVFKGYCTHHP